MEEQGLLTEEGAGGFKMDMQAREKIDRNLGKILYAMIKDKPPEEQELQEIIYLGLLIECSLDGFHSTNALQNLADVIKSNSRYEGQEIEKEEILKKVEESAAIFFSEFQRADFIKQYGLEKYIHPN